MAGNTAEIKTKLTADGSELTRALNQGIAKATDFRGQMMNMGKAIGTAFTVTALARFAVSLGEVSDSIQDAAGALALSTDELQAFDAVARGTAGGVDGMRTAIKKLVEVQAEAASGNRTASQTLDKLGLGAKATTASTAELVKALADYYKMTGDLATVHDLFGKQAVQVREALDSIGSQSLKDLISSMSEAGLIIDSQGIKTMAKFNLMLEEGKVKLASWAIAAVEAYKKAGEISVETAAKQNPFERYVSALGVQLSALLEGKSADAAADAGNRYFLGIKQIEERAKLANPKTPEEIQRGHDFRDKQSKDEAEKAAFQTNNEQYEADINMMQAKLSMEQESADIRKDAIEKEKADRKEIASWEKAWMDEIQAEKEKAFDWTMALGDADISARTPGQRPEAEWFGSALNKIGAIGSVKASNPEMQLSKDQLAALKKVVDNTANLKNLVLGTFQQ